MAACTAVIESSLSDKPSEAEASGGAAGAQGGGGGAGGEGGGGGPADCYQCDETQMCCVHSNRLDMVRCVDRADSNPCSAEEIPVECLTQDDCPNQICCAQGELGELAPVLIAVRCMDTCPWQQGRLPVCTNALELCGTQGYFQQCRTCSGSMPVGMDICWDLPC